MTRLDLSTRLPADVGGPVYDPAQVSTGIIHFGPGAFHRAHQSDYVDRLLASDPRWGVAAVSLRSGATMDALREQQGAYSLSILDAEPSLRVLAPHRQWIGPGDEDRLTSLFVDPAIALVTATVTEKGYCLSGDGTLDFAHPDIAHDVADLVAPRSFPGWLVKGLAARRAAGLPAFTTLSCDNLGQNGRKLGAAVVALAGAVDPELARWIAGEAHFPNTMVDSITPASDSSFLHQVAERLGCEDRAAVKREAFTQWVIERSDAPLPDFGNVGATLTGDVAAWERAKLRILNGAHSSLAYLGLLRGHATVADAMNDAELARFVALMVREEVWPSLRLTDGLDLDAYTADVLKRFRNPAIGHQLSQIAWDGSQKLPYRLVSSMVDAVAQGRPVNRLATAVAAWMVFCTVEARLGRTITDPLNDALQLAGRAAANLGSAAPFLSLSVIFPPALADNEQVRAAIERSFSALLSEPHARLA